MNEINSLPIFVATVIESVFNVFNVAACGYLIFRLRSTRLMHVNLKTMVVCYFLALRFFNIFLAKSFIHTCVFQPNQICQKFCVFYKLSARIQQKQPGKNLKTLGLKRHSQILSNRVCLITRFFYDATVNVLSLTLLGLVIERCAATFFVKIYESKNSARFALSIVFSQVFFF